MASTINVTGPMEVSIPAGVHVDIRDGVISLHFDSFSGVVALTPNDHQLSGDSEDPARKRARGAAETPADDSDASAPAAISALRTMQHEAFYRNGGGMSLSQDSEDEEKPEPRAISWEEAQQAASASDARRAADLAAASQPPADESAPHDEYDDGSEVEVASSQAGPRAYHPPEDH